ncbi:MAG: hypothetical protein ACLP1X_05650 [Polyangiaceae bacterium]
MVPGLSYRETMSGNYWRLDAPTDERAIAFTIEAHARSLIEFARSKTCRITGTIDAERLASGRDLEGTISFKLLSERRMPYRLSFCGDDGHRYELSGQREWSGLAPIESMTILPASLYDRSGDEVARATLRFDVRADWMSWIKSFRLRFGGD